MPRVTQLARLEILPNHFIEKDIGGNSALETQKRARQWAVDCLKDIGIPEPITIGYDHRRCKYKVQTPTNEHWLELGMPSFY